MGQETGEKRSKCRPKGAADSMRCRLLARSIHELSAVANDAFEPGVFSLLGVLNVPNLLLCALRLGAFVAVLCDGEKDETQRNQDPGGILGAF